MNSRNPGHHAVIMAGGIGSRFWPMSRNQRPKQFLDILGIGKSLIQLTFERLAQSLPEENIWVVSHADYANLLREQLPKLHPENTLLEPQRKNTAPCIALAAKMIALRDPEAMMLVAPADHLIVREQQYAQDLSAAFDYVSAHPDVLLTFGIQASRPDTGYGYIHYDASAPLSESCYQVRKFVEKPDHNTALSYLRDGNYVWNSGMFLWTCKTILREIERYEPEMYRLFDRQDVATSVSEIYTACPSISIDYAVMEKSKHAVVRTVDFGWSDLGTWGSLYELKSQDSEGNVLGKGPVILRESTNCLVENKGRQLIAIQGLEDFIVVNTDDVLLICQKSSEQKIKEMVGIAEREFGKEYV
ncbi:MAG TPA: mannose-1-phosphate guanylyltransferase [Saprospiraceae bacterium]|nr:mannose-1-phosphate guanylyltransferase [Saprospiraceae bacterium]